MRPLTLSAAAGLLIAGLTVGTAQAQTVPLTYSQALSSQEVQMVQQRLRQFGVYSGSIDGQWGPDSVIALQQFQQQRGIQPTGQLNEGTVASLGLKSWDAGGRPTGAGHGAGTPACSCLRIPAGGQSPRRGCGAGPAAPAWLLSRQCRRRVGGGDLSRRCKRSSRGTDCSPMRS